MQQKLVAYKRMPDWTAESLPKGFRKMHNTREGTWARLTIVRGELKYYDLDADGSVRSSQVFSPENPPPFIAPRDWHRVEPNSDDLHCYLEFYCREDRYYEKKYGLSAPHSEVVELLQHIQAGDALDLGCGRGRNSIFLQTHGFAVTALDHSEAAISRLRNIIAAERECRGIRAELRDVSKAVIKSDYDLIVATVVLQFLPSDSIPGVIENMQQRTRSGGINLIVAPISSPAAPCPIDWPFTLKQGELREYYESWTLLRYNENKGAFHRMDESGNPYECQFATLVARK